MKKVFMIFALATLIAVHGLSQVNVGTNLTNSLPLTTPANISQLETRGRLITQNAFVGTGTIPINLQTGSFSTNARWNSMGSLNAGSQILNGFRTQTDGRALTSGFSIPNGGSVSNPFIEWIGNDASTVTPGNLHFQFALGPTTATRVQAFTLEPSPTNVYNAFAYAERKCLVGQLEGGNFRGFANNDVWIGSGIFSGGFDGYGTTIQANGSNFTNSISGGNSIIQFKPTAGTVLPNGLKFRGDVSGNSLTDIMKMDAEGRIMTGSNPSAINFDNINYNYNLIVTGRDLSGACSSAPVGVGIYTRPSEANGQGNFKKIALYAEADGGSNAGTAVAVYGTINNASQQDFAGNFNGNVVASQYITASDKRLKNKVEVESDILGRIMKLTPVHYVYKGFKETGLNLDATRISHGFIADELAKVFPELVNNFSTIDVKNVQQYKAVNYIQLISILTAGMQEQQKQIEALKIEISTSKTFLLSNKTAVPAEIENAAFSLSQNIPNPFTESTIISYNIPANVNRALLAIFDLNGKMLLQYNLVQGKNQVTIRGSQLPAGMYIYSLIADGAEVVSKRMVLSK